MANSKSKTIPFPVPDERKKSKTKKKKSQVKKKAAPDRVRFRLVTEPVDYAIVFLVLFFVIFGLVMIYSTSSYKASLMYSDAAYWLKRQAAFALIGVLLMMVISKMDYHFWRYQKFQFIYYGVIVAMLLFTIILTTATKGAKRWIAIGSMQFQPSEIAKVVVILILAYYVSENVDSLKTAKGIITAFGIIIPIILLVGIENLSTSIILMGITAIVIFVASPRILPFVGIGAGGILTATVLLMLRGYRMERIQIWLNLEAYEKGRQVLQGLYAIGSGGLFGKGLGQSMQKMGFIPESHNDMIFSVICEELGLFGAISIIALFFVLLWRFMMIAINAEDLYGSLLVIGVIAHLGIQVFVNIGVVTNTIPNTGIPLPFISYGGSSLVFLLIEMGMVLSVSRQIRIKR